MPSYAESSSPRRLERTADTFVEIVDTLVSEFDVIDVLTVLTSRCVELLDAAAAGILLADGRGHFRVIGASTEQVHTLELFQIQNDQGPCFDCFNSGATVINADLTSSSPWPQFAVESLAAGFPSVCAVPLRLGSATLGCLNLFMDRPFALSDAEVALAQALADVASIAMVQDHVVRESAIHRAHLQETLKGRIAVEQAKGMIAERAGVDMDVAFTHLRMYAKAHGRGLTETAQALVAGSIGVSNVCA